MEEGRKKSIWEIGVEEIEGAGLAVGEARSFYQALKGTIDRAHGSTPDLLWRDLSALLTPSHPHALHQLVYYSVYARWDYSAAGPPPYWFPSL